MLRMRNPTNQRIHSGQQHTKQTEDYKIEQIPTKDTYEQIYLWRPEKIKKKKKINFYDLTGIIEGVHLIEE